MGRSAPTLTALLALGLLTALAVGCGASENKAGGNVGGKPVVLTLADHDYAPTDAQEFLDAVHGLSGAGLRIEARSGWRKDEIDYDRAILADLRAGKVDLATIGVRSLDELGVTAFQPLQAPLLIDSYPLERAALEGPIPGRLLPSLRRLGVVGVAVLPGALRRPFGRRRSLASPAAFEGATFGIRTSLVAAATVRALGGRPQTYLAGNFPPALDGAELDLVPIEGNGFDVPGSSLVRNVNLWPRMVVVVANAQRWRSLSAEQRGILRRAGRAALAPAITRLGHEQSEMAAVLCRRKRLAFVASSQGQLATYAQALKPVYAELNRRAPARTLLSELAALKRRLDAPPDQIPACAKPAVTSAAATRTSVDGVYRATTTPADLRRAGAPEDEVIAENYGTWIYVFDHGRFADTQENALSCTWGYGTYTLTGTRLTWTFVDGGGIAPNSAYNQSGEVFQFGWSRYRDLLTLSAVAGAISPANFRAAPLRRISSSPSRASFSRRCPPPAAALAR